MRLHSVDRDFVVPVILKVFHADSVRWYIIFIQEWLGAPLNSI